MIASAWLLRLSLTDMQSTCLQEETVPEWQSKESIWHEIYTRLNYADKLLNSLKHLDDNSRSAGGYHEH